MATETTETAAAAGCGGLSYMREGHMILSLRDEDAGNISFKGGKEDEAGAGVTEKLAELERRCSIMGNLRAG